MLETVLVDGGGRGVEAFVEDNALMVAIRGGPPLASQNCKIFRQYLTDDGLVTGSNSMGIDGSGTNVTFVIPADEDNDRYITKVDFLVGYGATAVLYQWLDSGAALTNGHRFFYERTGEAVDIHDAIKVTSDMLRLGVVDFLSTGWEARNFAAGNDYGFIMRVDLLHLLPPYGLKLDRGTTERLCFRIRDDNTDADVMNAIAYGFERFE